MYIGVFMVRTFPSVQFDRISRFARWRDEQGQIPKPKRYAAFRLDERPLIHNSNLKCQLRAI